MKKLLGLTTAMITPFDRKGRVNFEMLREMAKFQIEKGAHCLYPCGTTGEMYLLSEKERMDIAETVIRAGKGKITVYIHVGAMTQDETIRLARHAHEAGADGIGAVTPSYFKYNDREMVRYYVNIAKSVPEDFPVYLYNIPQLAGNDLKTATIKEILKKASNVVGIKYSYADFVRTAEYVGISKDFSVVIGADNLFHSGLAMGCSGTVSGTASVYPEPFVAIYEAYRKKKGEDILRDLQRKAFIITGILKNGNMAYFKAALAYRGYDVGGMRAPFLDLDRNEKKALVERLKEWESSFFTA